MSIKQKLYKVKIFPLQSMLNAIRCINQSVGFHWYIVSDFHIQPELSENDNPACKRAVPVC